MIRYSIDKVMPEYINMDREGLFYLHVEKKDVFGEVQPEISEMVNSIGIFEYNARESLEQIGSRFIREFKIRKDSLLGKYLIACTDDKEIVNEIEHEYISFEHIRNALDIAMFNDDSKITNKILTLYQNRCQGSKENLLKKFPYYETTLNYILENYNLDKYLARLDCEQESFVVYEEGNWSIKKRNEEHVRILKKGDQTNAKE